MDPQKQAEQAFEFVKKANSGIIGELAAQMGGGLAGGAAGLFGGAALNEGLNHMGYGNQFTADWVPRLGMVTGMGIGGVMAQKLLERKRREEMLRQLRARPMSQQIPQYRIG